MIALMEVIERKMAVCFVISWVTSVASSRWSIRFRVRRFLCRQHARVDLPSQCRRLFINQSINPGSKWLAIFNMILAIGSEFCQLSGQDVQHEAYPDVFFARARTLNDSENIVYEHDDLQQLQAEALMAFYLLSKSQINRYEKMAFS